MSLSRDFFCLLLMLVLSPSPGWAATEADDDPMRKAVQSKTLPLNGAEKLFVEYVSGTADSMELQGVVGDKIIWRKKFPDPDSSGPVQNISVESDGKSISVEKFIHYRPLKERFSWNGTDLKFVSSIADDSEKRD